MQPLAETLTIEIALHDGVPGRIVYEAELAELACAQASPASGGGFWSRLGVVATQWRCHSGDQHRWTLHGERRGLRAGFTLHLRPPDTANQAVDPLWTVGTLGREHIPLPEGVRHGDPAMFESAFLTVDEGRAQIARSGETWAELRPSGDDHVLVCWDSRQLAGFEVLRAHGDTHRYRAAIGEVESPLEIALVEAVLVAMTAG